MTQGVVVLPDAVVLVRAYLLSRTQVTALVSTRVYSQSPATPTYPYITVQRIGGGSKERRLDHASLQIDAWGTDEANASLVARTALGALLAARNYIGSTGVLGGCTEELGLSWQPDTTYPTPKARFVFGVAAHLHP